MKCCFADATVPSRTAWAMSSIFLEIPFLVHLDARNHHAQDLDEVVVREADAQLASHRRNLHHAPDQIERWQILHGASGCRSGQFLVKQYGKQPQSYPQDNREWEPRLSPMHAEIRIAVAKPVLRMPYR